MTAVNKGYHSNQCFANKEKKKLVILHATRQYFYLFPQQGMDQLLLLRNRLLSNI